MGSPPLSMLLKLWFVLKTTDSSRLDRKKVVRPLAINVVAVIRERVLLSVALRRLFRFDLSSSSRNTRGVRIQPRFHRY